MEEVKAKQKKARIDIGHPVERSKGLFGNIKSYAKERYEEKKAEISKGVSKKLGYAYEAPETRKMYKQVDIQEGLDKAKAEARISGIAKARISEIEQKYKPNAKDKTIENNKFFLTRQQQTMALQKEVKHKKQADTQIQKLAQYSLFKAQGEVSKLRAEKAKAIAGTRAKYREMKSKYPTNQGNLFGSNMVSSRQTMPPTQQPSLGGYLISKNQSQDKPKKDIRDLMFF